MYAQIEIDEPEQLDIEPIPYDGSYMNLPVGSLKKAELLGLIGEKVTFIDGWKGYFDFRDMNDGRLDITESDVFFENKTYEIVGLEGEGFDSTLIINSDIGTFKWLLRSTGSTKSYIFNKFIEVLNERILNKTFIPIKLENTIEYNDSKINLDGNQEYEITKIKFAKVDSFGYGFILELNNDIEVIYPTGPYDQPRVRLIAGEPLVQRKDWINVNGGSYSANRTLIEKSSWEKFKNENSEFLSFIREGKIKLGMTEQQVRYSWGIPNSSRRVQVSGADTALEYAGPYTLYFKNNKLIIIR